MSGPRDSVADPADLVCSHNEWDPLEEAIVGVLDGASIPPWHLTLEATMPRDQWNLFATRGGRPFPPEAIDAANRDLDAFTRLLEAEGVTVRRPDRIDHSRPFATPDWASAGGLYAAMPRDVMLVIGDQIIEAPMAWRSRYFEIHAYRPLLREYFRLGARWVAAPKPQLCDSFYDPSYAGGSDLLRPALAITELEPTFDAADFIRCGRDLFVQRSHVTNGFGIEWLRRHLGPGYTIHELEFNDPHPMHIDATLMPLAPGKLLVNPERVDAVPDLFKTWDVLAAPPPSIPAAQPLYMSSKWVSMNLLMLDRQRVVVEKHEKPLMRALAGWGLQVIPCGFRNFNAFGGSFHCATLDVRRRGPLESYF